MNILARNLPFNGKGRAWIKLPDSYKTMSPAIGSDMMGENTLRFTIVRYGIHLVLTWLHGYIDFIALAVDNR